MEEIMSLLNLLKVVKMYLMMPKMFLMIF